MENFGVPASYAFKCGLCPDKLFYNKQCMIKHIKQIHVKLRYPCDNCGKWFSSVDLLNIHFRVKHLRLKPYCCLYCNKEFKTNIALHNHIDIKHEYKSEYQCQCCGKIFDKKLPLKRVRPRRKRKLHKCRFCLKAFLTSRDKQVHLLMHKKVRNLKKCKICEKSFRNKVGLSRHMTSYHEKVSCVFCEKVFTGQHQLDSHIRLHINEKAFECKVCGKEFGTSTLRNAHLRTHAEQQGKGKVREEVCKIEVGLNALTLQDYYRGGRNRIYKCRVCYKEFYSYDARKSHMEVHLPPNYHDIKFEYIKANVHMEEDSEYSTGLSTRANSCYF